MRTLPRSSPSERHRSGGRRHRARRSRAYVALAVVPLVLLATVAAVEARRHAEAARGSAALEIPIGLPSPLPPTPPGTTRAVAWPIGTSSAVEGWRVKVIGVTADADAVLGPGGAPDAGSRPGYQWVAVSLHLARAGRGRRAPALDMAWSYVARDGRGYGAQPTGLPDDLFDEGGLRHGAHANGTLAFQVPSSEVGGGVLSIGFSRLLRPSALVRYWALS